MDRKLYAELFYASGAAMYVVINLIQRSCWFEVEPQPDDIWKITVKDDTKGVLMQVSLSLRTF